MPHIHEKIDFTATALIYFNDRVLFRKHDKYGIWIGVGGHVELDENPNQTVIREVKEEVGLDVTIFKDYVGVELSSKDGEYKLQELIPPRFMHIHYVGDTHQHIDMQYFCIAKNDNVIPEKSDDKWAWLTEEELEKSTLDIPLELKKYALMGFKEIYG